MWNKALKSVLIFDLFISPESENPPKSNKNSLSDINWTQKSKSVGRESLLHSLIANLALTILHPTNLNDFLAAEKWLDNKNPSSR
jgi:hypothetical protein